MVVAICPVLVHRYGFADGIIILNLSLFNFDLIIIDILEEEEKMF